jgi:hypothetical protein
MLIHGIVMVSVKVQVKIGNKMMETVKASTMRASNKIKSDTSISETCLQSKILQS